MALGIDDVRPGIVAYMSAKLLYEDLSVVRDPFINDFKEGRPYLCVSVTGDTSVWLPITTQDPFGGRLLLRREWRFGGSGRWLSGSHYIQALTRTFSGPTASFVAASQPCDVVPRWNRPRLSQAGLDAVLDAIARNQAKQHGVASGHDHPLTQIRAST